MNDLTSEARDLLEAARGGDEPTAEDRLRVRRALSASLGAGAAVVATSSVAAAHAAAPAATLSAASGSLGAAKVAFWVGAGLVVGLTSAGAMVMTFRSPGNDPAPQPARAATPSPVLAPAPTTIVAGAAPPAASDAPEPAAPARAPEPAASRPNASATARSPRSSLPAEMALLESARAALGRGDARAALGFLDEHERAFPDGAMTEERLASEVFAWCALGDRMSASRAAQELIRRAPASPLRARVLDSCATVRAGGR